MIVQTNLVDYHFWILIYFFIVSIHFNLYNPSFVFLGGAGFYIIIEFQTMFSLLISFFWVCFSGCLMDPIPPSFQKF